MEYKAKIAGILKEKCDAAVLTFFEDGQITGILKEADEKLGGVIGRAISQGEFTGKRDETVVFRAAGAFKGGPDKLVVVGLGKKEKFRPEVVMRAGGASSSMLRGLGLKEVTAVPDADGLVGDELAARLWTQGSALGLYSFETFKSPDKDKKELKRLTFVAADRETERAYRKGSSDGLAIAESVALARDMINTPANEMTPAVMAERAKKVGREFKVKVKVLDEGDCKELGMGAFLGVASGSVQKPRFITMEYRGAKKDEKPVVLVGKGITFDSGGISIKPSEGMEKMKYDMAGGAAVIAALRAAAALKLPVNVVGLVPATENLPSGSALKPGDVVRAMNGKTIEIISTDAEGRLVLSDALCYAQRYKPAAVIDIATLTGACVIALGDLAIGMMGNDQGLLAKVREAGEAAWERVWELPMWDEYLERMKGDVTDLKNVGGRQAATITAGKFLQEFVGGLPWVHLDIAGTAWEEKGKPYVPRGATATGARLLVEFLMAR